jgi:hypothetical protein
LKEISLHILDIVENSIGANACNIEISILEDTTADFLQITIKDDGKGMEPETVSKLTDPFYTSRTTRRVGLGLPLLKDAAEACNGALEIQSTPGKGTEVQVCFQNSHIDRMPMGDLSGTILTLMVGSPEIGWQFKYTRDARSFELNSLYITEELDGLPLSEPLILKWLREFIRDGILEIQYEHK